MSTIQSLSTSHQEVYEILSDAFDFPNDDQRLWWHSTAPMFTAMLQTADYDVHAQYKHLAIYKKHVIPFLGIYPSNGRERWLSVLTRYGTPFELSHNCSDSIVRYTFEPINAATGTELDPFNTCAIRESLRRLMTIQPTIDLEYFDHFKRELTLDTQESTCLRQSSWVGTDIMTQNKLALDLKGGNFIVKAYIYPALKGIVTGKSAQELIFGSVSILARKHTSLAQPLAMLEEYVKSRGPGSTACPRLLSCDLVDSSKSRIKIYISEQVVSLSAMQDLWTLGGRRNDLSTLAGFDMIQELWDLLQIPAGIRSYPEGYLPLGTRPNHNELLPSMANYTLLPNNPVPEPQLYFAVFGMNDMAVADALTTFFTRRGWTDMAQKYKNSLKAYYPEEDHELTNYIHAYVSFSYRKNKPYLGVYLQSFETGNWSRGKLTLHAYMLNA
ncbi:4-dimethylallyl tryptophan synthase [Annulohypoxylon truncatum]|uniref:4-dimethylallyl tryptophan synthase n=1 Tax=Annulohypoxylon truncatum TaxID=327061 RepID=UPI00200866AA|nr:4-dimethylallyl tryptophan synthase [Annulohypoxylon truncatum]KAI1214325.1 4-dimethylallyl tryptophan synthase [Annulohypoxylon truncatum]